MYEEMMYVTNKIPRFVVAVTVIASSSSSLICRRRRRRVFVASSSFATSHSFPTIAFTHHPTLFHYPSWKQLLPPSQRQQELLSSTTARRYYHSTMMLHLNRVLFHVSEIDTANNNHDEEDNDDDLRVMKVEDGKITTINISGSGGRRRRRKKLPSRMDTNYLATVTLPREDYRTIHVAKILKLQNGDTLRVGIVRHRQRTNHHNHHMHHSTTSTTTTTTTTTSTNIVNDDDDDNNNNSLAGLLIDNATIVWIPEGRNKVAAPTKNGDPPGSLCITIPHPIMTQSSTLMIMNQIISIDDEEDGNKEKNVASSSRNNDRSAATAATAATTTNSTTFINNNDDNDDVPRVSLLLALPRPLQLQRILPMVTQLGVEHILLTNANKVPKDYFGCRILRNDNNNNNDNNSDENDNSDNNKDNNISIALQNLLMEGLSICGNDVTLPTVTVTKRLRILLANGGELDRLFPRELYARVIAHPTRLPLVDDGTNNNSSNDNDYDDGILSDVKRKPTVATTRRMADVIFPINNNNTTSFTTNTIQQPKKRMLVAVGPEGGWEEPYELIMFANAGFQQVSLGARVLRSDVAVVSLLALANDICYSQ